MSSISNANPMGSPLPDGELPYDITRPSRRILATEAKELKHRREVAEQERANQRASEASADRVEVSAEAEILLQRASGENVEEDATRKQRIAELRESYLEGRLVTPALVEKAASQMLGGGAFGA